MTNAEQEWLKHLLFMKQSGAIADFTFIGDRRGLLTIGHRCTYQPDFEILTSCGDVREYHEVKGGYAREDSIIKLKCAATIFPQFLFYLIEQNKQGQWWARHIPAITPKIKED